MIVFPIPKELQGRVTAVSMEEALQLSADDFDGTRVGIGSFSRETPGFSGTWEEWIIFAELKPADRGA